MSLSAWRGTLNVVYTLVWFLSYYHGVTSLPAALTSERVYLGYKNVFTELDLDMDKMISLLDLYCIPTKISHSSPARKCTFTRVTSVLLAQEAPIGLFYERVIKEYDINGDGVVNEMEYWSQVNEAIAETQQDASKFDQVHQLISKVEECLPQENTCTDLLRTEASLALYGLFDQDVMRCINQSPCSNVCQCFQSPEKTSLTTRMQRRDLDVGQHPHHLQKRFWPLIAWLAVIVSNLAPAVIAVALLVQVIIISQADLDGAVVNVLDIGPLPEGNQPPNCCYSYYWSQCDKLRSSNSRTCHRGGELADSNSCTSEKASGGAICKRPFIGTNHCQSLCVVKNTNGCSCTIFEYVVANKQRIVGDEMDRIKTDKKSECFSWCLERTTCQGINMYFDPESKEPINCQFLSSKTGFATEEKTVAYSKQSNGGYKSDKQKLAEAIADFLNNNSCRRSNVSLVARGVSEINRNYLTETFIAIYAAWTVAKSIPISMNDAVDQLNGLFLIVQQASINQVLLHVNDAQVGRGVDPRHTLNAILCNEESVTQNDRNEKDVRFLTTDMVQVGRGDSFVLAFEHYKCRGNNRYTSENVRAMIECRLWNLDRLLVDGGPSAAAENIISRVRGSKITVEGVEQQGYISHLIITHLDEDHIGGIARLLENNPTIFNPNTRVMIDDLFSPNNRASVGAPISAACDNINQAVATSQDINAFIQAADGQQTPAGTLTRAMLKVHWYLARSPTGFQVSGSLHDLRWIEPSGLDLSFIGPSLPVMGNALRSPLMCGRGIGDFYAEKSRARNALSVIFAVNYGPNGRMLFTGLGLMTFKFIFAIC
ncbi:hypothetical protein K7432_008445 [Basidiobolus ranarum]|uniref:Metallo-beta-lactamase domain-containing protein n=1 Tax=Basidiobolus ranarum TaxID=34480 RepID=A0ABR2WRV5_9FUNG